MSSTNFLQALRAAANKLAIVLAGALFAALANATVLADISSALTSADPTQLGRISRNGIASDWSTPKPFPGVINPTTSYNYHTYSVNVQAGSFVQVLIDSLSANTFVSAYLGSYNPSAGLGVNYL